MKQVVERRQLRGPDRWSGAVGRGRVRNLVQRAPGRRQAGGRRAEDEEEGRDRMRLFGRHLLSVLLPESTPRRRRQEASAEALILGREYGSEMADREVTLKDTVEALIFFRTIVIDTVGTRDKNRVLELADQVLLGIVESHGKRTINI